jgi:hypothetical protein
MSHRDLEDLLENVEDTREIVLGKVAPAQEGHGELYAVWEAARVEANDAYAGWLATGGREAYAAYRAAADREDAAADTLAHVHVGT